MAGYNERLSALHEEQNRIDTMEEERNQRNKRILSAGEASYGTDSSEYEMLGGTRSSDRQRSTRKSTKGKGGERYTHNLTTRLNHRRTPPASPAH